METLIGILRLAFSVIAVVLALKYPSLWSLTIIVGLIILMVFDKEQIGKPLTDPSELEKIKKKEQANKEKMLKEQELIEAKKRCNLYIKTKD